jgi:hypothetical protein
MVFVMLKTQGSPDKLLLLVCRKEWGQILTKRIKSLEIRQICTVIELFGAGFGK